MACRLQQLPGSFPRRNGSSGKSAGSTKKGGPMETVKMETLKRIVIADANTLLREGLKRILGDGKDLLVVGEAASDVDTLEVIEGTNPDALLLDLNIPK